MTELFGWRRQMAARQQVLLQDGAAHGGRGAVALLGRMHLQRPQNLRLSRLRTLSGGHLSRPDGDDALAQVRAAPRRRCLRQTQGRGRPVLPPSRPPCRDTAPLQVQSEVLYLHTKKIDGGPNLNLNCADILREREDK